ncbi:MAG: PAS domain-containing sensor histidine kinase, partial [Chitinispirillia bacterium]
MENKDINFLNIIENIPEIVIITSLDGTIKYINSSSEKILGYSNDELKSTSIEEIIIEFAEEGAWKYIRNSAFSENGNYFGETHLIQKDRDVVTCRTNGFCIRDGNNEPLEFVFFFRDITAEKRITEELEKKNLEMARMNSDLIRSNKELKRVSEVKTKFLSIASHELKTPLTSIKGYAEIIIDNMKDAIPEEIFRMIQSIDRAADRLHKVINNMLDITRIEQKRLRLKPINLNLRDTAVICIEELLHFAKRRKISFKCYFENDLPLFYGDKMRIQQVFTNLFSNALKYSPDDSKIELKIMVEKEKQFHITVIDHGIGIDRDELGKIFDPFYEIADSVNHSTTNSVQFMGGGTGLGLSIVKG